MIDCCQANERPRWACRAVADGEVAEDCRVGAHLVEFQRAVVDGGGRVGVGARRRRQKPVPTLVTLKPLESCVMRPSKSCRHRKAQWRKSPASSNLPCCRELDAIRVSAHERRSPCRVQTHRQQIFQSILDGRDIRPGAALNVSGGVLNPSKNRRYNCPRRRSRNVISGSANCP